MIPAGDVAVVYVQGRPWLLPVAPRPASPSAPWRVVSKRVSS